jgi:steroid 5-alpha reductase family enzyme
MSEALNATDTKSISRVKSVAVCLTAYLAAVVVAIVTGYMLQGYHPILIAGAADLAATVVIFAFSVYYGNASIYDPYWSVAPLAIAAFWLLNPASINDIGLREAVVLILLAFWSVRLTFNWLRRWRGLNHEDWRYEYLREKTGRAFGLVNFLGIHLFPTVLVFSGCLSLYAVLITGINSFGLLDCLAIVVTAMAILIETKADRQLHDFISVNTKKGQLLSSGLWGYSRHPNYFGEVLFWWGLFLFALAANITYWWTIIGPVMITLLFTCISIPLIENHMVKRNPEYLVQMQKISAFIPWRKK